MKSGTNINTPINGPVYRGDLTEDATNIPHTSSTVFIPLNIFALIMKGFENVMLGFENGIDSFVKGFEKLMLGFENVMDSFVKGFEKLMLGFENVMNGLVNGFEKLMLGIENIMDGLVNSFEKLIFGFENVIDGFVNGFEKLIFGFENVMNGFGSATEDPQDVIEDLAPLTSSSHNNAETEDSTLKNDDSHETRLSKLGIEDEEIPNKYKCLMTNTVMTTPVYDPREPENKFDKTEILKWVSVKSENPYTKKFLAPDQLVTDEELKKEIACFVHDQEIRNEQKSDSDPQETSQDDSLKINGKKLSL